MDNLNSEPGIKRLIQWATGTIPSDSPRLDAEILLGHVLKKPRSYLFTWPEKTLEPSKVSAFRELVRRRSSGEPVAYLIGQQEFWSLALKVSPDVLIPRPETELLVEIALRRPSDPPLEVLDMGTGSGAIALAIAVERPEWRITATDASGTALHIAQTNARRHRAINVSFHQGDWYQAVAAQTFDLILSNPPYIAAADPHLSAGDLRFEPEQALISGDTGLDDIERIAGDARKHLKSNGCLLLEHGYDQGAAVRQIFDRNGLTDIRTELDLETRERVTLGRKI